MLRRFTTCSQMRRVSGGSLNAGESLTLRALIDCPSLRMPGICRRFICNLRLRTPTSSPLNTSLGRWTVSSSRLLSPMDDFCHLNFPARERNCAPMQLNALEYSFEHSLLGSGYRRHDERQLCSAHEK